MSGVHDDLATLREELNACESAREQPWVAHTALARVEAELSRLGALYSCGYAAGRGQNCGKCQQCLLVHEHFLKKACEQHKAELSRLRDNERHLTNLHDWRAKGEQEQKARAVAAEARCERLQQAAGYAEGVLMRDPFDKVQRQHAAQVLREALAGLDTPADSQEIRSYGFDGYGRAYARYASGEVMLTGYVARSFAGKSDVTPERYAEIAADARAKPTDSQEDKT